MKVVPTERWTRLPRHQGVRDTGGQDHVVVVVALITLAFIVEIVLGHVARSRTVVAGVTASVWSA